MGYIYIIQNICNYKSYVGQTIQNWERRIKCHFWEANRSTKNEEEMTKLNRAILKYGINNFVCKTICICDDDVLDEKEIFYIKIFNSYKNGYNSTLGGQGSSNCERSITTRNKIRTFQIEYNKRTDVKTKKKSRMTGNNHPQYNVFGINNKNYGITRKNTLNNIDIIIEIRKAKASGICPKELALQYNKCHKTIMNWCGPDFEKYGGPTTTNYSIKLQSQKRREKNILNRAVQRADVGGSV